MYSHKMIMLGLVGCMLPVYGQHAKTKFVESKTPSTEKSMEIKNDIIVPLSALAKETNNAEVKELLLIAKDLFKLSSNKIAAKYDTFLEARKSFEPGLQASEFKFAYLESWIDLVSKRVRKIGEYKERLDKIQQNLTSFDKKLDATLSSDKKLYFTLNYYSKMIKEKIDLTNTWIDSSRTLFTNELNMLKSREKRFTQARVPMA